MIASRVPKVDLLVNNAGASTIFPPQRSADGVELTFQVNYLGHWLFTQRLLPLTRPDGAGNAERPARRSRIVHFYGARD